MIKIVKNFILLGHHRSGTSYLLDLIRHHSKVDTINEPFSMHLEFFRESEEPWGKEQYNNKYLHEDLRHYEATINYIKDLDKWMNEDFPNVRGFKETLLFEKYFWLKEVINFEKTIILVRDPRAVINSIIKRNMHNSWWSYEEKLNKYYKEKIQGKIIDSPILICAYLWKFRIESLKNIMNNTNSEDLLLVKLEDVRTNQEKTLKSIMSFLGLEIDNPQLAFLKETSQETRNSTYSNYRKREDVLNEWQKNFTNSEIYSIEEVLGKELREFNYK